MSDIRYDGAGRPMVPGSSPDGSYVPVAAPGAAEEARRRHERDVAAGRATEEARRQVRLQEEAAHQEKQRARRAEHEAEVRARSEDAAAAKRAAVERDLRLDGAPEHQIKKLADDVMAAYFQDRALDAVGGRDRTERELRDFFRARRGPSFD